MNRNSIRAALLTVIILGVLAVVLLRGQDPAACEASGRTWQACSGGW